MAQITKTQFMSERIEETFFSDFSELFAHFNVKALMESLSSYLQLNYTAEELRAAPVTPGEYRMILALSTITLLNRDAVTPLADLNEAAEKDLAKLRRETGIDLELIPEPALKPPTEAELLESEVRSDWRTLSMDKIRQKKNASRKYSETLERLANAGTLESSVTALTRAGA